MAAPSELDSETQVFDLDFVDRDGRHLGGIRDFTVKRAPREALLRGLGGDATRLLYTLGWHEVPPPERGRRDVSGTWLIAGFGELAAGLPGCISFDRTTDPSCWDERSRRLRSGACRSSGIVWRSAGPQRGRVDRGIRRPAGGRDHRVCSAPCTPRKAAR